MEKDEFDELGELIDVLIQLRLKESTNIEPVIKGIEDADGHILHVYPPYLIIARIPEELIMTLKIDPTVHSVDTEEIRAERLETAPANLRLAFTAWNEYLHNRSAEASTQTSSFLSWDAPGRLPPDPPPHMREILRKREEEQKKGDSDLP